MSGLLCCVLREVGLERIPSEVEGLSIDEKRRLAEIQDVVIEKLRKRAILKIQAMQCRVLELQDEARTFSEENTAEKEKPARRRRRADAAPANKEIEKPNFQRLLDGVRELEAKLKG